MSDDRMDLSPLDPAGDPATFERMVHSIMWRARGELARRAQARELSAFELVATWYRPALVASAVVVAISVALLATVNGNESDVQTGAYMSGAEVPAAMSVWFEEDRLPSAAELLVVANQEATNGSVR